VKIEVRCPGCSVCYLLDEQMADVDLCCPACSTQITMRRPAAPAESAAPTATWPSELGAELAGSAPPEEPTIEIPALDDDPGLPEVTPQQHAPQLHAAEGEPVASTAPSPPEPAAAPQAAVAAVPEEVVCPRCQLHFSPRRIGAESVAREQRHTVLVVEDLAYFQEIAKDALADAYDVVAASTVAEARQVVASRRVDLLILDLTLDGGDHGLGLLRELEGKRRFPVLIYTAQDESEMYGDSWDELRALGADDIVIKGMNVGESLLLKVNALLGNSTDD
jgi:CheY-like chemotaxis protein